LIWRSGIIFFFVKTKKLSYKFSKTDIHQISKHSVFIAKVFSSKPLKKLGFKEIFNQAHAKKEKIMSQNPQISEDSIPKLQTPRKFSKFNIVKQFRKILGLISFAIE